LDVGEVPTLAVDTLRVGKPPAGPPVRAALRTPVPGADGFAADDPPAAETLTGPVAFFAPAAALVGALRGPEPVKPFEEGPALPVGTPTGLEGAAGADRAAAGPITASAADAVTAGLFATAAAADAVSAELPVTAADTDPATAGLPVAAVAADPATAGLPVAAVAADPATAGLPVTAAATDPATGLPVTTAVAADLATAGLPVTAVAAGLPVTAATADPATAAPAGEAFVAAEPDNFNAACVAVDDEDVLADLFAPDLGAAPVVAAAPPVMLLVGAGPLARVALEPLVPSVRGGAPGSETPSRISGSSSSSSDAFSVGTSAESGRAGGSMGAGAAVAADEDPTGASGSSPSKAPCESRSSSESSRSFEAST
jgi:hypothetical protein